jgi:hypothetical protein
MACAPQATRRASQRGLPLGPYFDGSEDRPKGPDPRVVRWGAWGPLLIPPHEWELAAAIVTVEGGYPVTSRLGSVNLIALAGSRDVLPGASRDQCIKNSRETPQRGNEKGKPRTAGASPRRQPLRVRAKKGPSTQA